MSPYDEGYNAFNNYTTECPFEEDSLSFEEWHEGYEDAFMDSQDICDEDINEDEDLLEFDFD